MTLTELTAPGYYARALTRLLGEPGRFYSDMGQKGDSQHAMLFLVIASLFHAAAGLLQSVSTTPARVFFALFLNGIGMACLCAVVLFSAQAMMFGRKICFGTVLSIVAYSSGVTLLVSWVPFFIWLTEPWKWWLIITGLVRGCGFKWWQALAASITTVMLVFLLFWTLLPALLQ